MVNSNLKSALVLVAIELPNKHIAKPEVLKRALDLIGDDVEAQRVVSMFVKVAPQHWGIDRRAKYWSIAKIYFSDSEIVDLYLRQFPDQITRLQYGELGRSLRRFNLSEVEIRQCLLRFKIRPSHRRCGRDSLRCYVGFVS